MSNRLELHNQYHALSVLVVDDEVEGQGFLKKALTDCVSKIDYASSIKQAEERWRVHHYDIMILNIRLPLRMSIEWQALFDQKDRHFDIIFIIGNQAIDATMAAIKLGVNDFILKPFNSEQIKSSVIRCIQRRLEHRKYRALARDERIHCHTNIIGNSEKTKQLRQIVNQYAPSKAPVLIEGESGTGKEIIARNMHERSERSGPFVSMTCSMLTSQNVERELFGCADPIFEEGLLRLVNHGTLFLDEVGDMSWEIQEVFLRVLEKGSIKPIGSTLELDIKIIAATHHDLTKSIENGTFHRDLYDRLAVLRIDVAPLSQHKTDLIELFPYLTRLLCHDLALAVPDWINHYFPEIHEYNWPGNVRELKNMIERCLLLKKTPSEYWAEMIVANKINHHTAGVIISVSHTDYLPDLEPQPDINREIGYPNNWNLKEVEKSHIIKVVNYHDGNKSAAAKTLGVSRKTLERKYKEWCIDVEDKH